MDQNNHPPSTPIDPFDYDPLSLDDELLQVITSVISSPTPPHSNETLALVNPENQTQDQNNTPLIINNNHGSVHHASSQREAEPPRQEKAGEKGKKKQNAIETERKRRQVMSSLYQDLRSLLPAEYLKRKRSTSDLLQEATKYITHLEEGIKGLNDRKKELLVSTIKRTAESSSNSSNNTITTTSNQQQKYTVTIKPCKEGLIEVIIGVNTKYDDDNDNEKISENLPLSKVLNSLIEEGLDVINCVSSRFDDKMVHTIQTQVDDGRNVDLGLLRQTLTYLPNHQ